MAVTVVACEVKSGGVDYCYSDIGCFPLSAEFYHPTHRPFNVRPWHRRRIRTQFEIFNEQHPNGFMLRPWDRLNLQMSGFDPRLDTKIIIPGWLDNIRRALWVRYMRDAFQWLWTPVNVIVVRWRNFTPYTIATANTRVVGAELANMLKFIEQELNYDRSYFHIIGHSLGAHIAGYCGDRLPGLGRITALDPARPFFQHMPRSVRLDRGDARFVDAIHSDFTPENAIFLLMSFGMTTPVGHVDFYPNGPPLMQPGCLRDTLLSVQTGIRKGLRHSSLSVAFLESLRYLTACDHQRSHEWFIESIVNRQCVFVGVRCNEFEGLINGRCTCDDSPGACAIMGIHADQMYMNKLHEHIWPSTKTTTHHHSFYNQWRDKHHQPNEPFVARPTMQPPPPPPPPHLAEVANAQEEGLNADTREETYARLKLQATQLRQTPVPILAIINDEQQRQRQHKDQSEAAAAEQAKKAHQPFEYDEASFESIGSDEMFINYLRALMLDNHDKELTKRPHINPHAIDPPFKDAPPAQLGELVAENDLMFKTKRMDLLADDYVRVSGAPLNLTTASHLPKLLSDYDREIEDWYEDNSRWHLRTQSRPAYCANQYQVLVFIGPLQDRSGRRREARLRSNLIISIIGTRGQLINQRFVPRSAQLDSFTMQPFYILLEGAYSLGTIKSVAIGWEARHDPDPIQATVTFQNNLLEAAQPFIPAYKAKHPVLPDLLAGLGRTRAFEWASNELSQNDIAGEHLRRGKRSTDSAQRAKPLQEPSKTTSSSVESQREASRRNDDQMDILEDRYMDLGSALDAVEMNIMTPTIQQTELDLMHSHGPILPPELETSRDFQRDSQLSLYPMGDPPSFDPVHAASDGKVSTHLNNIDLLINDDAKDATITIEEVIVSPVEAWYGRGGRVGKVFCPPHNSFKLHREQTVQLIQTLVGQCHQQVNRVLHPILTR